MTVAVEPRHSQTQRCVPRFFHSAVMNGLDRPISTKLCFVLDLRIIFRNIFAESVVVMSPDWPMQRPNKSDRARIRPGHCCGARWHASDGRGPSLHRPPPATATAPPAAVAAAARVTAAAATPAAARARVPLRPLRAADPAGAPAVVALCSALHSGSNRPCGSLHVRCPTSASSLAAPPSLPPSLCRCRSSPTRHPASCCPARVAGEITPPRIPRFLVACPEPLFF